MDLASKSEVKSLLKKYRLRPSKGLGQNFLINRGTIDKVIRAADLKPEDIVLEIGPGLGVLTRELAKEAKKVIAVEKDPNLAIIMSKELIKEVRNIEVAQGDILKILNSKLPTPNSYNKVIANLPFYLTAPVIRKFLESDIQPKLMALIIQKEVAQRICAKIPDMNLLAISVQFYARPKIISYISKKSFWPQPKVDSTIIKITTDDRQSGINKDLFFKIVKAGFSQPRKQLINNLSKKLGIDKIKIESWLLKNDIQPEQRAETLTVKDWIKLTETIR
ncbi:MAG TPA: 16S rRNA (adenine(1518)-N(6)/adenine(1519)-N(6))-dimethyltransferase RsmA [Candidatus Humimicrobiaceae bacterium]|nr:16S rRNA (adenine(1518)-N(6)/adenine(1519)-N(6))-dimethyltransferase RsmA [Candidatus Humimicrobiaceae bacterium]